VIGVIVAFLAFVVLFTLLFRHTTRVIGTRVSQFVNARHKAAEAILEDGRVPADWAREARSRQHRPKAARRHLQRRLKALHKYFQNSPLVDGEDTRRVLLAALEDASEKWEEAPLERLLSSEAEKDS
jgi:hypothetical protein